MTCLHDYAFIEIYMIWYVGYLIGIKGVYPEALKKIVKDKLGGKGHAIDSLLFWRHNKTCIYAILHCMIHTHKHIAKTGQPLLGCKNIIFSP